MLGVRDERGQRCVKLGNVASFITCVLFAASLESWARPPELEALSFPCGRVLLRYVPSPLAGEGETGASGNIRQGGFVGRTWYGAQ